MGSILSLPTVYAAVHDGLLCEVTCITHVKYCNHLLAVDMAGVTCRRLWCACGWKKLMSKDIGIGVRKGTVVSFVPTLLFGNSIPICLFKLFFCDLFR